jgi:hypothetical protein
MDWEAEQSLKESKGDFQDALVSSYPEWSKKEQSFAIYNNKEKKMKQYQSILIPTLNGITGSNNSLQMMSETALDDPSTTETWYHATTFREAEEIMKNGFRFRSCMKNRNFSDRDGIYFTDSITSAKQLGIYPDIKFNKKNNHQYKIAVLAFTYNKEKNNLLEKYKKQSIDLRDLRDPANEERLKKIVQYFSKDPLPTSYPTIKEHGLDSDYKDAIEYIIGPHAIIFSSKVYINRGITQLCIRCVGRTSMKQEFEDLIQKSVFVLDLDDKDICK